MDVFFVFQMNLSWLVGPITLFLHLSLQNRTSGDRIISNSTSN